MKSSSTSHVRVKIVALLSALAALWAFAAWVTARDSVNLLFVNAHASEVGIPTEQLAEALQQERRISSRVVGGDVAQREALAAGRAHTDEIVATWQSKVTSRSATLGASERLRLRVSQLTDEINQLAELREAVDGGELNRRGTVAAYTEMIDASFAVYASLSSLDDREIAQRADLLVKLSQARELLSRQDAVLTGALAAGSLSQADITEVTELISLQRFLYDTTAADLVPEDLAIYEATISGAEVTALRALEDRFLAEARAGAAPPYLAGSWEPTVAAATAALREMELAATDELLDAAVPVALGVIIRLVLAGGLGMIAVIAAVVVSITTARALVRQLERLRDAARDLADNRLPGVVDRLSRGEQVDVAAQAPPLQFGDDEIGQVGKAFNAVQETAVRAAVQQAELRHGVRDVFLSLARRTQSLVHKQLSVVDAMERRETDAEEMEDLYRIDHLATRMRRNAENLIVLSGATPGRTWRTPVQMVDVIRGAIGETEDYQRVNLLAVQEAAIEGRVVGDVIHLLAELIENAASFSPPYAMVGVGGQRVAHGFVVEIEDRGLGMSEEELTEVNQRLADPPDFSLADASRLGHYVVAKLAQRHGVRVHLRTSPYGGVTAIVLIPQEVMADDPADAGVPAETPTSGSAAAPVTAGPAQSLPGTGRMATVPRQGGPVEPMPDSAPTGRHVRDAGGEGRSVEPVVDRRMSPAPGRQEEPPPLPVRQPTGRAALPTAGEPVPNASDNGNGSNGATTRTPSGLPWRVRQASLPKQLWDDDDADDAPTRDPEEVRRAMSSYQLGTQRGRSAAADPQQSSAEDPSGQQPGDREEG